MKPIIKPIYALILSSALLAGCATTDMTGWTPEQIQAHQEHQAQSMREISASLDGLAQTGAQLGNTPSRPLNAQVGTYGQQPSTAVVYCRDVTGALIACRQVN